eukprot:4923878-Pleurochrysis_carterae.AAC.1
MKVRRWAGGVNMGARAGGVNMGARACKNAKAGKHGRAYLGLVAVERDSGHKSVDFARSRRDD